MNTAEKIQNLYNEVEIYKQAIEDAQNALASAESELEDMLAETYEAEQNQ